MVNQLPILQSLLVESHSYELNNQMKVWLSKEVGTGDEFAQDMGDHCYLLMKEMAERDRLIAELEKLAVGFVASHSFNNIKDKVDEVEKPYEWAHDEWYYEEEIEDYKYWKAEEEKAANEQHNIKDKVDEVEKPYEWAHDEWYYEEEIEDYKYWKAEEEKAADEQRLLELAKNHKKQLASMSRLNSFDDQSYDDLFQSDKENFEALDYEDAHLGMSFERSPKIALLDS
ncbi:hypothetical protein Tco_0795279 [Tanacetum coccineum]